MKAITIKQPFASLIVEGIKDIENRTWKTNLRGRVLIHAGAKSADFLDSQLADHIYDFIRRTSKSGKDWSGYPFSAIIGSVEIVDCVEYHKSIWAEKSIDIYEQFSLDRHEAIYNWVLANPIKFHEPIPCKGRLSFWESDVEICHICGQPTSADYECKVCGEYYCDKCAATYDTFSQIDFNCCSKCQENERSY